MFHRETDPDKVARNREAIFDLHGAAIRWLEDYTGIEYPFGKFGFVLIPPFQFGGMEHPGAVTYRASSLMLEESATQAQMLGRASLIAHETAHMWFGDLVTMRWFDDVWTKEVFANFMAAKIVHPSFPEVNHDLRFLLAHHPSAYGVDRTRGANPIRQPLANLNEAGSLYGAIIYQKAPIVMKQLESLVGEDTFRDGLREYLATFAYGNATWPDLIRILDGLHPADLAAWSRVWVEEAGRPRIEVLPEMDPGGVVTRVTLRQSDDRGRGLLWPQRLDVHLETSEGGLLRSVDLTAPEAAVPVEEPMLTLDWVLPNASGVEYGLFILDDRSLGVLVDGLGGIDDPVLRGAAWVTLWDAVLEGQLAPERFLEVALDAVAAEPVEQLLGRILSYAETTYWRLLSPEAREGRWQGRFEAALEGPLFGSGLGATDPTRATLLFRTWTDVAGSDGAVDRMRGLWAGERTIPGVPLSETDRTSLALGLALREAEGWRDILDRQEGAISNPDRLARFRFVRPAVDPDPSIRRTFFESLRDPANREREPWVLSGLGYLNHPNRAEASVEFVLPALEMMEEIQRTGDIFFPTRWIGASLQGHNTGEVVGMVNGFLESRPDYPPRLAEKILQASDMVERSARILHGGGVQ
jgi:aminopeptidase N